MQGLSTKFETCIGGIIGRLISLSKPINNKDRFMKDSLENSSSSTNNIKVVFDQKANQILNKTSAVLYGFLGTIKAAPHECKMRTGQP